MLYTLLCYNKEEVVWSWSKEEDDALMTRLGKVQEKLTSEGRLGPSLRLMPTIAATTLRQNLVMDGPFAETKEQLLGFYLIEVPDLQGALEVARALLEANPTTTYEVRPVALFMPDQREETLTQMVKAY